MLDVVIWDVQHGSAAYLKTPSSKHFAIDLGVGSYGSTNEAFSPLLHLKHNWHVPQLDGVIISHPHSDHLDDIDNFYALAPKTLIRPKHLTDSEVRAGNRATELGVVETYIGISNYYSGTMAEGESPFLASNNGGVEIQTFTPEKSATSNLNNHSIVTVLSYEQCKMLIPGDNEPPSWNELLEQPRFRSAISGTDILVAPHHGRESGYSPELFNYISPYLTIVSDGRFGDTSATSRYSAKSRGLTVFNRSGGSQLRKCVTTRSDGVVVLKIGKDSSGRRLINVKID